MIERERTLRILGARNKLRLEEARGEEGTVEASTGESERGEARTITEDGERDPAKEKEMLQVQGPAPTEVKEDRLSSQ